MAEESLRGTFDEDAELYDRARPGYPPELFDELFDAAGLGEGSTAVEVGPGTGQATLALAARGVAVTAIELGPGLAAVLQRKAAGHPVRVLVGDVEHLRLPLRAFDAVTAFTAWHWLTHGVRVRRAYELLRPGGVLATVTTEHVLGGTSDFFADAQSCYERWDPATPPGLRLRPVEEIPPALDEVDGSELFEPAVRRRFTQDIDYTTETYLDVVGTYSGHRALAPARRDGLLACLASLIEDHYQGRVTKRYLYELRVAVSSAHDVIRSRP